MFITGKLKAILPWKLDNGDSRRDVINVYGSEIKTSFTCKVHIHDNRKIFFIFITGEQMTNL